MKPSDQFIGTWIFNQNKKSAERFRNQLSELGAKLGLYDEDDQDTGLL